MSSVGDVVPCLKDPNWGLEEWTLKRPLWRGQNSPLMPSVAFGWDHPHTFEFLNRNSLAEHGVGTAFLEGTAIRNLCKRKTTWEPLDIKLGWFKRARFLVCGDDYLAAEKILDPAFMNEAQRRLGANGLLVGIPRRSILFAMDAEAGVDRVGAFMAAILAQFESQESAPITPALFAVRNGTVVGMITAGLEGVALPPPLKDRMLDPAAGAGGGEANDDGNDDGPMDEHNTLVTPLVQSMTDGSYRVLLIAQGEDGAVLGQAIVSTLAGIVHQYPQFATARGELEVKLVGLKPEVIDRLRSLEDHLRGIFDESIDHAPQKRWRVVVTVKAGVF